MSIKSLLGICLWYWGLPWHWAWDTFGLCLFSQNTPCIGESCLITVRHLNAGSPLVTITPRKVMTPTVMILVLLLGLMGLLLLLLFFPLSLFDNVLYCIVQSCTALYDTYNYYIALLLYCNNVLYYIILCYTVIL